MSGAPLPGSAAPFRVLCSKKRRNHLLEAELCFLSIKALSEARTAMVGVHNELNDAKLRLGIRTKMNSAEKPTVLSDESQTTLREVV